MGAHPKPRPGVALLAREDLPSRAVCSLLRASCLFRDWSKSIGGGAGVGPEQRGGGSSVFEPLVRGGSCNF